MIYTNKKPLPMAWGVHQRPLPEILGQARVVCQLLPTSRPFPSSFAREYWFSSAIVVFTFSSVYTFPADSLQDNRTVPRLNLNSFLSSAHTILPLK